MDTQYSYEASQFEPIDMSLKLETATICDSLFALREALSGHKKSDITDFIRYSYILSMELYLETQQARDYGRC